MLAVFFYEVCQRVGGMVQNCLGIFIMVLLVAYHYIVADPKVEQ